MSDFFVKFKNLADRKKEVYDDDLIAMMRETTGMADDDYLRVKYLKVVCGSTSPQSAELVMDVNGEEMTSNAFGDGPVDASFKAVTNLFPHKARLKLYQVNAVTQGTDAQATVTVKLEENGNLALGQSADTDTVYASVKAYVSALNNLYRRREVKTSWKEAP